MTRSKVAAKKLSASLAHLGKRTLQVAAIGVGFAIREFIKFENALLGVAKTANLELGPSLDRFGEKFVDLSKKIPVSAVELLNLGKSAAQLGVKGKKNILNFAEVMAKLARTTNIVGEEGATQLARLITVTGGSTAQVENFASAIVELGNTTAVTEGEILEFATRLGGAGALFGITGTQALGLAATLKAVGVRSEEGASSIGRGLGAINKAIIAGGEKIAGLSKLTGIASKDLKKAFGADAVGVLAKFTVGLDKFIAKGNDATQTLAFFGLEGIRDLKTLGLLAKNTDLFTEKLAQSKNAFKKNIALQKEFNVILGSLGTKFFLLFNNLKNLGRKFVLFIKPALETMIAGFSNTIDIVSALGGGIRTLTNAIMDLTLAGIAFESIGLIFNSIILVVDLLVFGIRQLSQTLSDLFPKFEFLSSINDFLKEGISGVSEHIAGFSKFLRGQDPFSQPEQGVATTESTTRTVLDGTINVNAPPGVVSSVNSTVKGSSGNLGISMAGAG